MKTCCNCRETKPESEFHKQSRSKDGLDCRCRACRKYVSPTGAKIHDSRNAVLALLSDTIPMCPTEIAALTGLSPRACRQHLSNLEKCGLISMVKAVKKAKDITGADTMIRYYVRGKADTEEQILCRVSNGWLKAA